MPPKEPHLLLSFKACNISLSLICPKIQLSWLMSRVSRNKVPHVILNWYQIFTHFGLMKNSYYFFARSEFTEAIKMKLGLVSTSGTIAAKATSTFRLPFNINIRPPYFIIMSRVPNILSLSFSNKSATIVVSIVLLIYYKAFKEAYLVF